MSRVAKNPITVPKGVELVRFADADSNQSQLIRTHLGSLINRDKHIFAALNDSWLADGLFLHVDKNIQLQRPIEVLWLTTRQNQPFSLAQRLLVVLEDNAEATVVEQFASSSEQQNSFTNGVTELIQALGLIGVEHHLAGGGARRGGQAGGHDLALGLRVEGRVQQLIQRRRLDAGDGLLLGDHPLSRQIDGVPPAELAAVLLAPSQARADGVNDHCICHARNLLRARL